MITPLVEVRSELPIRGRLAYLFEHGHLHINQSNLDRIICFEKELGLKRESQGYLSPEDLETLRTVLHYKTEMLFKMG